MLTTSRRFASTSLRWASISPCATLQASVSSCSPLSSGKRPISARYWRMALSTPKSFDASSSSSSPFSSNSSSSTSNTSSSWYNCDLTSRSSSTSFTALFAMATIPILLLYLKSTYHKLVTEGKQAIPCNQKFFRLLSPLLTIAAIYVPIYLCAISRHRSIFLARPAALVESARVSSAWYTRPAKSWNFFRSLWKFPQYCLCWSMVYQGGGQGRGARPPFLPNYSQLPF